MGCYCVINLINRGKQIKTDPQFNAYTLYTILSGEQNKERKGGVELL